MKADGPTARTKSWGAWAGFAAWASVPILLASLVAAASILGLVAMGWDKRRARLGGPRIPERTLFAVAALGGSPGVGIGMALFHHKTRKAPFVWRFWGIVALQAVLLLVVWFLRPEWLGLG